MRKSKFFVVFLAAFLFLAVAAAYTVGGTLASAGKVVPPGWCLEHGHIGIHYGEEFSPCPYCE